MPRNYDARNTARTGGKVNAKPLCSTCGGTKTVRVSKRRHPQGATPKQQYDIIVQKCPDCK